MAVVAAVAVLTGVYNEVLNGFLNSSNPDPIRNKPIYGERLSIVEESEGVAGKAAR